MSHSAIAFAIAPLAWNDERMGPSISEIDIFRFQENKKAATSVSESETFPGHSRRREPNFNGKAIVGCPVSTGVTNGS
jgi:hypothetical protein